MFDIDESIRLNQDLVNRVNEIGDTIKIDEITDKLNGLEKKTEDNDFWNNTEESSVVLAEISGLKSRISKYNDVKDSILNDSEILEMLKMESDEELEKEIVKSIAENTEKLESLEIQVLFSDILMLLLQFIRGQVALRRWIGLICFIGCILDGLTNMVLSLRNWII